MQKGVRWIKGREYLLCGRAPNREAARVQALSLATQWKSVRIIKLWEYDFLLYVHGFTGSAHV